MDNSSLDTIVYRGPSMYPALFNLDILHICAYNGKKIRCGDVVVFSPPDVSHPIAHRVVSITPEGIKTRGDNNKSIDGWTLAPGVIIGKVVYVRRNGRCLKVWGGLRGRSLALITKTFRRLKTMVFSFMHPVYHWFSNSSFIKRFLPFQLKLQTFSFKRPEGEELQMWLGPVLIARRSPVGRNKGWQIRKPFRLLISEESLPS